jgi:hypothetical protein
VASRYNGTCLIMILHHLLKSGVDINQYIEWLGISPQIGETMGAVCVSQSVLLLTISPDGYECCSFISSLTFHKCCFAWNLASFDCEEYKALTKFNFES